MTPAFLPNKAFRELNYRIPKHARKETSRILCFKTSYPQTLHLETNKFEEFHRLIENLQRESFPTQKFTSLRLLEGIMRLLRIDLFIRFMFVPSSEFRKIKGLIESIQFLQRKYQI